MTDTEDVEAPFSANFKTSPGYEAAMVTVRGNTVEEFLERIDDLSKEFQAIVDANNLLQAVNTASAPEDEPAEEKKSSGRRSSSSRSSGRGGSRGGSGNSRGSSRGSSSEKSREIAEEDLHPEGLICGEDGGKKGCKGRVHYKEIRDGEYKLWVCEFQRARNDGHFSEFIND